MEFHGSQKVKIISLELDAIGYHSAMEKIVSLAKEKIPAYVCFVNVHMTIEAYKDNEFAKQVNSATLGLADGVPIVRSFKLIHGLDQERIAGMDAMATLIHEAGANDLRVFFFGTTPDLLEKIRVRAVTENPRIQIVGALSPPFSASLDDPSYIDQINRSNADLVFVALGCPKQEKWMATHSHKVRGVMLGVGGAFPVYARTQKRAPKILRNAGLEWLYRLYQEPGRLLSRYARTNSLFIYLLLKTLIRQSPKSS